MRYAFAALVVLLLAAWFGRGVLLSRIAGWTRQQPAFVEGIERYQRSQEAEATVVEQAAWFGTTGLGETLERGLPRYLRLEFGELLLDEGSLKAADLRYVGKFEEGGLTVHYWTIPTSSGEPTWAYIEVDAKGTTMTGWGGRAPPGHASGP